MGGDRFVSMHPAGRGGAGVEAKVLTDSVRPLYPEFGDGPPPRETTYSGIGPVGATVGAALLSASCKEVHVLGRKARMASSRPLRLPGRRRATVASARLFL